MGLGLESANLEHTASFAARFREAGDEQAARVQETVGREEIAHVRFGARWFEALEGESHVRGLATRAAASAVTTPDARRAAPARSAKARRSTRPVRR